MARRGCAASLADIAFWHVLLQGAEDADMMHLKSLP